MPNCFVSPQLADFLENEPDPESKEVAEYIRNGITLKEPSQYLPPKENAGTAPREHDICTLNDLFKGNISGGYLGPIPYTGQTHAVVHYVGKDGSLKTCVNKLKPDGNIFRVKKSKRLMVYAGRLVTDLSKNLLNDVNN